MRLSITDAPACGYDHAWITVQKLRVHRSSSAAESDPGWVEVVLSPALRVDLLSLTNGTLVPLGQTELPAGTYTQMRLVLAENGPANPLANSIVPTGGSETALTTPSAQQSGLKMNVNLEVPAGQVADFAIDFDACKSFVKAGNSGKILLKPVLSVLPILSSAGQRVQGWLHPALVAAGATVSVQAGGEVRRATPPGADGKFVLYPVPVGNYDLVVTAGGRVNAVVTGVPVSASTSTTVNSIGTPIDPPLSGTQLVSGKVTVNGIGIDTGGFVRALQQFTAGPTVEIAADNARPDTGAYGMALATGAPVRAPYVAGATQLVFSADAAQAGRYRLEATVARTPTVNVADVVLGALPLTQDFDFVVP
jgi:hypothetical protein